MAHNEAGTPLDVGACLENLGIYAQAGDARSCRDIGIALARELDAARAELARRDAIHEADEVAMLRASGLDPCRELAEWLASLDPSRLSQWPATHEIATRAREALGRTEGG